MQKFDETMMMKTCRGGDDEQKMIHELAAFEEEMQIEEYRTILPALKPPD